MRKRWFRWVLVSATLVAAVGPVVGVAGCDGQGWGDVLGDVWVGPRPDGGGQDGATGDAAQPDAVTAPDGLGPADVPPRDLSSVDVPADVPAPDVPPPPPEPVLVSAPHRTWELDLGMQPLSDTGYTPELSFAVPAGIDSLVVFVEGTDGVYYVISKLNGPDGERIIPHGWERSGDPTFCPPCKNRVSAGEGAAAFGIPAAPNVTVTPGTFKLIVWGFRLEVDAEGYLRTRAARESVRVRVFLREPLPAHVRGRVDLNLFFTGAGGLTAATAPASAAIRDAVAAIDAIYGAINVGVGDVHYADATEDLQVIETLDGEGNDLSRLFAYSAGHPAGLNLFFVREILGGSEMSGGFAIILGIAGGIPGPPLVQGTPRSGVAVVLELPWFVRDATVGTVAAHEMGHYLGLYHTSEQEIPGRARIHDALADTPEDDPNNLMYFSSTGADPTLTPDQGFVVRKHPLVRDPEVSRDAAPTAGAEP